MADPAYRDREWKITRDRWAERLAHGALVLCRKCDKPVTSKTPWDLGHGLAWIEGRITSYNVCYTKLLRKNDPSCAELLKKRVRAVKQ